METKKIPFTWLAELNKKIIIKLRSGQRGIVKHV